MASRDMTDTENLQGTTRTLDGARRIGRPKNRSKQGLISRSGWALVDDSTRPLFDSANFNFNEGEKSPWPWVMERPAGDRQDLVLLRLRPRVSQGAGRLHQGGRPHSAAAAFRLRHVVVALLGLQRSGDRGDHSRLPPELDVPSMSSSSTWTGTSASSSSRRWAKATRTVRISRDTFSDGPATPGTKCCSLIPAAFLDRLHADHLKTSLNLHPASGIQPWEEAYPAMAKAMGIDPATKQYVPFDITNKKFAKNYINLVLHPLEKQGIDFWWLDWQQEQNTKMAGVNPTWWLNYVHFTDQEREGKRPLLFHRWGGLGNHRYQIGFSGDTVSVWDSLAFQPWFTATAANVGYAYWSHDIGGHMPGAVDPELFTRWVEFGAFSPILRTHTTKNPDSERRIWAYPEPFSSILRSTFQLALRHAALHLHRGAAYLRHRRRVPAAALLRLAGSQRSLRQQERIPLRRRDAGGSGGHAGRQGLGPGDRKGLAAARVSGSSGPRASTSPGQSRSIAASPSSRLRCT